MASAKVPSPWCRQPRERGLYFIAILFLSSDGQVPSHAIPEQRLQQARTFKEEGNHCYKEGRFRDAVSRYHWALLQIKGLDPNMPFPLQEFMADKPAMTADQEKELYTIRCDCYNNLAGNAFHPFLAKIVTKPYQSFSDNVKALYRAGVAFYHLGNYDKAQHYLLSATSRQPKDANVKRYLQLTKSQLSIYLQQEKQLYMGMFG
uniref:Tetratricopeptide repeat protein 9C n=1 Tax=Pseudonaja textilis TaxID=8673 RepID=A0A670ZGR5_PSETE